MIFSDSNTLRQEVSFLSEHLKRLRVVKKSSKKIVGSMTTQLIFSESRTLLRSFFFSSRRRHTRCSRDWSSDVCSSDLCRPQQAPERPMRDWPAASWPPSAHAVLLPRRPDQRRPLRWPPAPPQARPCRSGRSEERRVGKKCRSGGGAARGEEAGGMRRGR